MIVSISLTRYFTCDEANTAFTPTWHAPVEKLADIIGKFIDAPIPDLPDLGCTWREMTDDEAREFVKSREDDDKHSDEDDRRMICFIDKETTGLLKPGNDFIVQPGIVQIAAVKVLVPGDFQPINVETEFNELVNPEAKFEEQATRTHGINADMVQDKPTFFTLFPKFAEFVLGCDTWGGYNIYFDKRVLAFQLERYGFERNFPWPPKDLDVMKLAKDHAAMQGKRGTKAPTLGEIYEALFGESFKAHDALADIKATVRVWEALTHGE